MRNRSTNTRLALLAFTLTLLALPIASASAAEPWWQVLSGSRPTNLWEPQDGVLEIKAEKAFVGGPFKEEGVALKLELDGAPIGCLGTANFLGTTACEVATGFAPTTTAAQLEALLEGALGSELEVTGGPVGAATFTATFAGAAPALSLAKTAPPVGSGAVNVLAAGGSGRLVLTLTNLGTAPVDGSSNAVEILDELPEGVEATWAKGFAGVQGSAGPVACSVPVPEQVLCSFEGELRPFEAIEIEVLASLTGAPPAAGAPGRVSVSGGGAAPASAAQTVKVSPEPTPFGIEHFSAAFEEEGGDRTAQAGAHPFQFTTTVQLNSGRLFSRGVGVEQPALPRNLRFPLPAGLAGNVVGMPQCPMASFLTRSPLEHCRNETAVGVISVTFDEPRNLGLVRAAVPIFNLPPAHGQPARFGFIVAGTAVIIDIQVDPEDGYRLVASVNNITQLAQFLAATTTLWGTPGDPRHDNTRGWSCVKLGEGEDGMPPCERPSGLGEGAFLRVPVQCADPLDFDLELEPWNVPIASQVAAASYSDEPLVACNHVPFDPKIDSAPTTKLAETPSGLDFRLTMPNSGLLSSKAVAEGQAKKVEVTLPEGMSINPSQAEGLATCSPAEYAREKYNSAPGAGCPDAAKLADVQIQTPLLDEQARGSVYVATPHDNPFNSLIALYMVARIPERGILVKQAGRVDLDPETGQVTTTFDDIPQLPVSDFSFRFRPGARAPLVTPPACGEYDITARFIPWSASDPDNPTPGEIVTRTSSFQVERGVDGGACPKGGLPPFKPELLAGTRNNAAGSFSPFDVRMTRKDGEQEITHFSIKLPPGVAGKLTGIPFCTDQAIARAASRTGPHGGQEELDDPSCPVASQVGRTLAGAGVGSVLTYAPGKVYLAGPYHGSPISFVSVTSGVVGPFDIGTVVVRLAIRVNPETGEVFLDSVGSDPIPHIIKGVVLHVRDIRAYTDRPEFTFNPTSCAPKSTAATVLGSGLDFASEADDNPFVSTSPFQAADCAALSFAPKLSLSLTGATKRGGFPKLKAFLRMKGFGEAGIARSQVTLPRSEFIANAHFDTICTRAQFKLMGGNGEACPAGSIYGWARAKSPILADPVEGPIFLRSSEHELPDVVASLRGQQINVHLVGHVDSVKGQLRTTFETVPDAPVEWASFSFKGGDKGLFENSTDLCLGKHKAKVEFTGQNGKRHNYRPAVKAKCAAKKQKKHQKAARRGRAAG